MPELIPENLTDDRSVLVVADLYGTIVSVSESVSAVFGYEPDSLIGQSIEVFIPVDLRTRHRDHMSRFARRPHARTMGIGLELHGAHADGSLIPVEVSLRVFKEQDRTLVRAVVQPTHEEVDDSREIGDLAARVRQLELTSRTLSEVYELVTRLTSEAYSNRATAISRFDSDTGFYVLESVYNLPLEFKGWVSERHEDGLITRATFVQGVAIYPGDSAGTQFPVMFQKEGLTGGIAATIGGRYEPFGAIAVYFGDDDPLRLEDAKQLQTIATEVSRFVLSAQTEEALSRESKLQSKLAEIGRIFSSTHRVEDVYSTFAGLVNDLIPHHRITLAEIDHSTQTISTRYSINTDGSDIEGWESGSSHDLAGTSAERMVKTLQGLYMNFADAEEFARELPGAPDASAGLTGVLNIPLIVSGVVVGTLTLNSSGDQKFDDESLLMGERIAAQISGSFLSASLSESLEKETALRGTLNDIGEVIGSSLDFASMFPKFAEILRGAIEFDLLVLTDVDIESRTKIDFLIEGGPEEEIVVQTLEDSVSGTVVDENRLVDVSLETLRDDIRLSAATRANTENSMVSRNMTAWVAAPLNDQGKAVGVLHLLSKSKNEYDLTEREFVNQVASRVASAVVKSRLHEAARKYARQQEILVQISREIGSSLDSSESFDRFSALLAELVPVDRVAISNVDVSNQTAETLYVSSDESIHGDERASFRTGGTPTGHSADIGETVVINSPEEGSRFSEWVGVDRGIQSSVTVPMGRDGDFARIFQISCADAGVYGAEQVSIVEQVANQIAAAVANQQLYRRSIELAQERERSIRLEAEAARLTSVNEAKNDFLNLLTHELKTPLTSIIAFADLLARGGGQDLSKRQSQQLQVIQRNAWHLDALIQDLVDVSSIERGNIELEPIKTDVSALVTGVLEGLGPSLNGRGQTAELSTPEDGGRH